MFNYVIKKLVGTKNQRELKKMGPVVTRIQEREGWAKKLTDQAIRDQVQAWKKEIAAAKDKPAVLEKILRYEVALDRQLYRAMNHLERLQRRRAGENVPPPLTMEVSRR